MPGSSKWSLSLRLPHQNPVDTSLLPHMCYVPCPSHSYQFDHPINIWCVVQIMKLLIVQFLPLPCHLSPLRPKYSSQLAISNSLSLCSSISVSFQVSHPYKRKRKIIVLYSLIFIYFWIANWKTKDSAPNDDKHFLLQFALNFFLNRILICYGCSQIFELFSISMELLLIFILWLHPAFLFRDMTMYIYF